MYFLEIVNMALQNLKNHKVLYKGPVDPMKDHDWSWTLLGAALVSLESLDMIFDV